MAEPTMNVHDVVQPKPRIFPPFPKIDRDASRVDRGKAVIAWLQASRPMRALKHWNDSQGSLLAGGMAYAALFSFFAGILVLFSVAGLVLANRPDLIQLIIDSLADSVPGLIGDDGVITPDALTGMSTSFTVAGAVALLSGLWTAMNFLNGARISIRRVFDLPPTGELNFAITKLRDLGLMVTFGIMVIVSALLTAASTGLTTWLFQDVLRLDVGVILGVTVRLASLAIGLTFDAIIIVLVLRVMCQLRLRGIVLWQGAFVGAVLLFALKQAGSMLLGGASSNPLLATFAALLGVLIFFNFACMVLLITASWVKVTMDDHHLSPRLVTVEEAEALTRETERQAKRERLATESIRLIDEMKRTPRWRRRRVRREYERVVAQQRELEAQDEIERVETFGINVVGAPDASDNGDDESGDDRAKA